MSGGDEGTTAHVYCGNFVATPAWHDFFEASEECSYEGDVPLPKAPEEHKFAVWVCPSCGATNTVRDHS